MKNAPFTYLICIDANSNLADINIPRDSLYSTNTIDSLGNMISVHGYPKEIVSNLFSQAKNSVVIVKLVESSKNVLPQVVQQQTAYSLE